MEAGPTFTGGELLLTARKIQLLPETTYRLEAV
jgi:hypothetical protein